MFHFTVGGLNSTLRKVSEQARSGSCALSMPEATQLLTILSDRIYKTKIVTEVARTVPNIK